MSTIDSKLDKLLEDVATVKAISNTHSNELRELKDKLEPVFFHVAGMQWGIRLLGGAVGLIACIAGVLALIK